MITVTIYGIPYSYIAGQMIFEDTKILRILCILTQTSKIFILEM